VSPCARAAIIAPVATDRKRPKRSHDVDRALLDGLDRLKMNVECQRHFMTTSAIECAYRSCSRSVGAGNLNKALFAGYFDDSGRQRAT
jgi:hypothetical protein